MFYLGDHDPSGVCIEEDAARRVRDRMLGGTLDALGELGHDTAYLFQVERLAIHPEDIRAFDLPPLKIKMGDSRAGAFYKKHGGACVELDALPPVELRRRLKEAIEERIDRPAWDRAVAVERVEIASIRKIAGQIAGL